MARIRIQTRRMNRRHPLAASRQHVVRDKVSLLKQLESGSSLASLLLGPIMDNATNRSSLYLVAFAQLSQKANFVKQ